MPSTTSSIQRSSRLSGLKTALLDEQRALGLDTGTFQARADSPLRDGRGDISPASEPIAVMARNQALL